MFQSSGKLVEAVGAHKCSGTQKLVSHSATYPQTYAPRCSPGEYD